MALLQKPSKANLAALHALANIRDTLRAIDNIAANSLVEDFNKVAVQLGSYDEWMVKAEPSSVLARGKSGWKEQ